MGSRASYDSTEPGSRKDRKPGRDRGVRLRRERACGRPLPFRTGTVYNKPLKSGASAAWLAHSVRDAGVVGSNPTSPIFFISRPMIIKSLSSITGFKAGDSSFLRELLHPDKERLDIGYSLAHALVKPGQKTLPHRLKSAEVYYVLEGRGLMHIDAERAGGD